MPAFSSVDTLGVLVVAGYLILSAGVVILGVCVARLSRVVRSVGASQSAAEGAALRGSVRAISGQVKRLESQLSEVQKLLQSCVRHVGVVRYDAFRDMGGHMSFSLALLDDDRNGIVLTVLNGRDGSRGYAKAVQRGKSSSPLSEEEQEAMAQALNLACAG
ncbi:MAG: DUF4446 family protein [Armatimonadota bacterium]|nr:DUF4446 family protein [Armatimonadota bacterium]